MIRQKGANVEFWDPERDACLIRVANMAIGDFERGCILFR